MQNADPTTMNSAQLGAAAAGALQDPAVTAAQNDVNSAQSQYTQGIQQQGTLPQMLSASLNNSLGNTQDPQREQDLAALLTNMNDPLSAVRDAESNVPGAILSPAAQSRAMAEKMGTAAARVSANNEMLGARGMGIAGILGVFSNYMANNTQRLLAQVQNAQGNRDFLWQKAQSIGNMAMGLSQLKQSAEQFNTTTGLKKQEIAIERESDPLIQATAKADAMKKLIPTTNSFDEFYAKAALTPALSGISKQDLYAQYIAAGGKGDISEQLQRDTGIQTADRWRNFVNTGSAQGATGAVIGDAGSLGNTLLGASPYLLGTMGPEVGIPAAVIGGGLSLGAHLLNH